MRSWHLITGEYPPKIGGVGDYSQLVARGLAAAGDNVHVWTSAAPGCDTDDTKITVHRLPGHFGYRALAMLDRSIGQSAEDRLLVQYVPHAFGFKAMNLPFCAWLFKRRRAQNVVMFHEVLFPMSLRQPLRHNLIGAINRIMALLAARSAQSLFVASWEWERLLRRYVRDRPITWLPVPSNIPVVDDPAECAERRRRYIIRDGPLVGHFGTYGAAIVQMLNTMLPRILVETPDACALLIGVNSLGFRQRFIREHPELAARVHATGELAARQLSLDLSACDIMVQPYPDGVSARRGSIMAALAHGRAVATTRGVATEPLWEESGALSLSTDAGEVAKAVRLILSDHDVRTRLGNAGRELYAKKFDLGHTITALRRAGC